MDLLDSGEHCSVPNCKQSDVLPFLCFNCKSMFCKSHFMASQHGCKCSSELFQNASTDEADINKLCTVVGCNKVSVPDFFCKECNQSFCMTHRHHDCLGGTKKSGKSKLKELALKPAKMRFQMAKAEADKKVEKTLRKAEMDPETQVLANKIRMMKLKGKSVGDEKIKNDLRMYFSIHGPIIKEGDTFKPTSLFTSKTWTVAKTVDEFSMRLKIANTNYKPQGPKLGLFKLTDGSLVSNRMHLTIDDLVQLDLISDGDSLILDYIDNEKWADNKEKSFLANMNHLVQYQSASLQYSP